jgi:hypothetical protein
MAIMKNTNATNFGENVEEKELLCTVVGNVN